MLSAFCPASYFLRFRVSYELLCSVHTMEQWKVHGQKGTGKVLASKTFFRGITEAVHKPAVALDFGPSVLCPGDLALEKRSIFLCTCVQS